jgi:hypothetical protein
VRGGETLKPGHLCLLAAAGVASVSVARRPVVGIIATGSELKDPGTRLLPGQIYESNRVGLAALLKLAGQRRSFIPLSRMCYKPPNKHSVWLFRNATWFSALVAPPLANWTGETGIFQAWWRTALLEDRHSTGSTLPLRCME